MKTDFDQHQTVTSIRSVLFHPVGILGLSLGAGALFTLFVTIRTDGLVRSYLIWYFMPVGVVFIAFILDRLKELGASAIQWLIMDLVIVLLSLARAITSIPFYSGHALFLSYSLLSARSLVVKVLSTVVLLQVIYLKLVKWDDWVTLTVGVLVGSLAGYYRSSKNNRKMGG